MSDDKNDNVVNIFDRSKKEKKETDFQKVSHLVDSAVKEIIDTLSDEDRKDFEKFLWHKHPELAMSMFGEPSNSEYFVDIRVEEIAQKITELEQLFDRVGDQLHQLNKHYIRAYADLENSTLEFMDQAFSEVLKALETFKNS